MSEFIYSLILSVNEIINHYYLYAFCLYFLTSVCFFTFSLPGGLILLIGSGFFFGFFQGFLINIISISLGSLIFINFSKNLLNKFFNKYYLKFSSKISSYVKKSSYEYLILIRLVIGPPLIFQNICLSMISASKVKIFFTTIIGFSLQMFLFSYIGNFVSNIVELQTISFTDIFSIEILSIFLIFAFLLILRIIFKN